MTTETINPAIDSHRIVNNSVDVIARLALAVIFILAGVGKITGYDANVAYMASVGLPAFLLPFAIVAELGGGIALVLGLKARWVAAALAGFSALTAVLFHSNFADPMQVIGFWKNIAIAGGLLLIVRHGAGPWSIDKK